MKGFCEQIQWWFVGAWQSSVRINPIEVLWSSTKPVEKRGEDERRLLKYAEDVVPLLLRLQTYRPPDLSLNSRALGRNDEVQIGIITASTRFTCLEPIQGSSRLKSRWTRRACTARHLAEISGGGPAGSHNYLLYKETTNTECCTRIFSLVDQ